MCTVPRRGRNHLLQARVLVESGGWVSTRLWEQVSLGGEDLWKARAAAGRRVAGAGRLQESSAEWSGLSDLRAQRSGGPSVGGC